MSPDFTISVLNFGVSIGLMGLIIVVIAVCLVVMTVALFRMKTTTEACYDANAIATRSQPMYI